jgi:MoaA/NifB/PqqE/SkfB family radical SAM enzyme
MTTLPYGARPSAASLIADLASRHPVPVSAIVQVTRRCNLRCRHCFQVDRAGRELTTAQ